ncbi:ATP-dependent DNA ligase [Paenibacillus alvei]|uniref:ATP-dependent DNA ligase n=1 Tax=Paenibacillus alvei TaxID=44250 RepID=UPI00227D9C82|nr:RNA ligase family protein [Paenibacillus alvei]MCY9757689.1 ATP-dependent DNA ligase [Paenibacillus alvei]
MQNIIDVFKQIKETSSRTGKEAILKANKDNEEFRFILKFLYNPFDLTGIGKKKLQKFDDFIAEEEIVEEFTDVFNLIRWLRWNKTGSDEVVKAVANFINEHDGEVRDFLKEVITKSYKCGITAGTINKVYNKGTIPDFAVLLAKAYKDHGHKLKGRFYITLKLDGIRCVAIKKEGVVQFYTRQGQPINELIDIEEEIAQKIPDNFVLDGELLLENPKGLPSDELFRATQKVVRKDGVKQNLEFNVFDGLPLEEFLEGKSKLKYEARRNEIAQLFNLAKPQFIRQLPVLYVGEDKEQISVILQEVIANGHEGLMINTANGHYVTKRSDVLLKVKEMHTVDLRVVGYEEGSGKFKGTLGALIVDYKGYEVKVGSGFTDEDRKLIWGMGKSIIGRVIETQFFEESSNEQGGISLRFPVFKMLREEGKEVSYH